MIIFSSAYILSEQAAGRPLTHPRIGWQTYTRGLAVSAASASTQATEGPADAPLRPDTAEYWQPTALPATWTVDLGVAHDIDYIGIAGHTIGSTGGSVEAFYSANNTDWYSFTDTGSFLSSTGEQWTINGTAQVAFDSSHATGYLLLPGTAGNNASTPDSVAISIPGDIDLRWKVAATDYTPSATSFIAGQVGTVDGNRAWKLEILTAGTLNFQTSPNGTTAAAINHISTVATGLTDGSIKWLRVTLDADNGAAGHDVKFYTSDDGSAWAQLGATITTAGVTSIFNSTANLVIGENTLDGNRFAGKVYYGEVRNGIAGTVVSKFDPLNDSSFATAPGDDSPIMILNDPIFARYWRTRVTGTVVPKIAVVHVGEVLAMERAISGGFSPINLSRETTLKHALSRGGRFLGQNYLRNGVIGEAHFSYLSPSWYRTNFDPFVLSARRFPFFFGWMPQTYPTEIVYAWATSDIKPSYMGLNDFLDVSVQMRGIGND